MKLSFKRLLSRTLPLAVLALFLGLAPRTPAQVLYAQLFGDTTGAAGDGEALNSAGTDWISYLLSTNANDGASTYLANNAGAPLPSGVTGNVNSLPAAAPSTTSGYAYELGISSLWVTSHAPINPASYPGLRFSWVQADANASTVLRLVVEVGGVWYASAQGFGTAAGGYATLATNAAQVFTYTTAASSWYQILVNGSTGGALGSGAGSITVGSAPSSDLNGTIQAFGLVDTNTAGADVTRFDSFVVTAVPEPASSAGLATGLGALLLLVARRGRRMEAR